MALSTAAHWNQNQADWLGMLERGRGWGIEVADPAGPAALAASTLVLPYEDRFAWISMVLVLPAWRGRGLARRLLHVALDDLARARLTPVLDATPAGHPVYLKQGFVDTWGFARRRRPAGDARPDAAPAPGLRPLQPADWPGVAALDAPAFGADRLPLLRNLAQRLPAAAWVLETQGAVRGFLLGRDGRTAVQLGPWLAPEVEEACALLGAALGALAERGTLPTLVVDLRNGQPALEAWLEQRGFAYERPFTRMVRSAAQAPGDPRSIALVAGPELG
jgi:GNAT superfamily N-acetyltransferase